MKEQIKDETVNGWGLRGRERAEKEAKTAAQKPNLESPWISYAQGNGLHVAVDSAGTVWTSKDGHQWTLRDG